MEEMDSNDSEYMGLPLTAARELAEEREQPSRVIEIDGEAQIVTMDHVPNRLNFKVEAGVVTGVTRG